MKKDPSRLQLLIARSALAAIFWFLIIMVPVDLLLSRYLFKGPPDVLGCLITSVILGLFLHKQLASKYGVKRTGTNSSQ